VGTNKEACLAVTSLYPNIFIKMLKNKKIQDHPSASKAPFQFEPNRMS